MINIVSLCYCDDCVNRVRIGQELNKGDPRFNNFWHPNGGWGQANAFDKDITFTKGEDLVKGFRCAVKRKGTEFHKTSKSVTAFASCCGTICYQLMRAHPGMFEVNNLHRLKGWRSPMQQHDYKQADFSVPIGFQCAEWTGAMMPDGTKVKQSMGKGGMSYGAGKYPGGINFYCGVIVPMFCSNVELLPKCCCCFGRLWAQADCCCLRHGRKFSSAMTMPPKFDLLAQSTSKMVFNGHELKYYHSSKKYLKFPFHGTQAQSSIQPAPIDCRMPGAFEPAPEVQDFSRFKTEDYVSGVLGESLTHEAISKKEIEAMLKKQTEASNEN